MYMFSQLNPLLLHLLSDFRVIKRTRYARLSKQSPGILSSSLMSLLWSSDPSAEVTGVTRMFLPHTLTSGGVRD